MKAALKLFCENGFQNTSTANISKEADVATGTLFLYFPSKEGLINTLYLESKQELSAFLQEGLARQKTPKTRIRHVWMKANEWAMKNQNASKSLMKANSLIRWNWPTRMSGAVEIYNVDK